MRDFDELPQDVKYELDKYEKATNGLVKPNNNNILRGSVSKDVEYQEEPQIDLVQIDSPNIYGGGVTPPPMDMGDVNQILNQQDNIDYGFQNLTPSGIGMPQQQGVLSNIQPQIQQEQPRMQGYPSGFMTNYNYGQGDTVAEALDKVRTNFNNPIAYDFRGINTGNYLGDLAINTPMAALTVGRRGLSQAATGLAAAMPIAWDVSRGFANRKLFEGDNILDNMTPQEKLQYAKNAGLEREYEQYLQYKDASKAISQPVLQGFYNQVDEKNWLKKPWAAVKPVWNALYDERSNLNSENMGRTLKAIQSGDARRMAEALSTGVNRFGTTGLSDAIDVASFGMAGVNRIKKIAKVVQGVDKVKPNSTLIKAIESGDAAKASDYLNVVPRAKAAQMMDGFHKKMSKTMKTVQDKNVDLPKVLKSIEEGDVQLTPAEKSVKKEIQSAMKEYHDRLKELGLAKDTRQMAIAQYLVRKHGILFDEAMKIIKPIFENPDMYKPTRVQKYNNLFEYAVDTLSDITGKSKGEIRNKLRKDISVSKDLAENVDGDMSPSSGKIRIKDVKNTSALSHEINHWINREIRKEAELGNVKAKQYIEDNIKPIHEKLGIEGDGTKFDRRVDEYSSYNLERYLNPDAPIDPMKFARSRVVLDYEDDASKWARKNWEERLTSIDKDNMKLSDAGLAEIDRLAETDDIYKSIKDANKLYDDGEISLLTHADADADIIGQTGDIARRYSSIKGGIERVHGGSSYDSLAKIYENPDNLVDNLSKTIGGKLVVDEMADAFAKVNPDKIKSNDLAYVSKDAMSNATDTKDLLKETTQTKINPDDIPVSKKILNQYVKDSEFLSSGGSPYKQGSFLDKAYRFERAMLLASGNYLSGNISSTAFNTILNSNLRTINDIADSTKTAGRLGRMTGVRRNAKVADSLFDNKILDTVDKYTNRPLRSLFNKIDVMQQNAAVEMAINNYLGKKGIPVGMREAYLKSAPADELYDIISSAQDAASMNTRFSLIPEWARPFAAAFNPFYRWTDTAVRSTAGVWKRNPLTTNLVVNHLLTKLPYDLEMQHRLRINADMDKPYAHIVYNPKTGMYRDESNINSPQATAVVFGSKLMDALVTGDTSKIDNKLSAQQELAPVGMGLMNTLRGTDNYGNVLYRTDYKGQPVIIDRKSNRRYVMDNAGNLKPINGLLPDEILPQVAKQTIAPLKFFNQNIMPATQVTADLLGYPMFMFNPSSTGMTSSFNPNNPNINPSRGINPSESLNRLMGTYTTKEYDPSSPYYDEQMTPNQIRQLMRTRGRGAVRQEVLRQMYGGE